MVTGSLIAACIAALIAALSWVYRDRGCTPQQSYFRTVAALVWLSLAALYLVALAGADIYLIRAGILTRLMQITIVLIYIGEITTGRRQ